MFSYILENYLAALQLRQQEESEMCVSRQSDYILNKFSTSALGGLRSSVEFN